MNRWLGLTGKLYETPSNNRNERPMSGEEEKTEAAYGESTRHAAERELGYRRAGFHVTANNQMAIYNPSSTLYQSGILNADAVRGNLNAYLAPSERSLERTSMHLVRQILGPLIDPYASAYVDREISQYGGNRPYVFLEQLDRQMQHPTHNADMEGWPLSNFVKSVEGMDANHPDIGPGNRKFLKRNMDAGTHAKKVANNKKNWRQQANDLYAALPSTQRREARRDEKAARTPEDKRKYLDKFLIPRLEKLNEVPPAIRRQMSKALLTGSGETDYKNWPSDAFLAPHINRKKTRYREIEDAVLSGGKGREAPPSSLRNRKTRRSQYSDLAKSLIRLQEENTIYMRNGKLYRRPKGG